MSKISSSSLRTKAERLVRDAPQPVGISYLSNGLGLNWSTARALVFELVLEGKIKGIKTGQGWLFWSPEKFSGLLQVTPEPSSFQVLKEGA
jgi:hypothetical protein